MTTVGSVVYDASIDTGKLRRNASEVERIVGGSADIGGKAMVKMGAVAGVAMEAASRAFDVLSKSIGGAVSRIDTMNRFPTVMQNLGYSAEDAKKQVERMAKELIGLPTALDSLTTFVNRVAPVSGSLQKATDTALAFNNAVLAGGGPVYRQADAIEQFSQMLSKGVPDMMAWRTLQEAMPATLTQVAKGLGITTGNTLELYDAIMDGTISFEQFTDKILELNKTGLPGFKNFADQAKDATTGIATGMQNAQTAITRGLASIGDAIGAPNISKGIANIGIGFESVLKEVSKFVGFVRSNWGTVTDMFSGLYTVIKSNLIPALESVGKSDIARTLVGSLVPALRLAIGVTTEFVRALSSIVVFMMNNQSLVVGLVTALVSYKVAVTAINIVNAIHSGLLVLMGTQYVMLNGVLVAVRTATIGQTLAQTALNLVMAANPVGLFIAVLGLLVGVLVSSNMWTDLNTSSTDRLTSARETAKATADRLREATDLLTGATRSADGATLAVERAQRTYNDTLAQYGPGSLEAREAAHNLRLAEDGLKDANDRVRDATAKKMGAEKENADARSAVQAAESAKQSAFSTTTRHIDTQVTSLGFLNTSLNNLNGKNFSYTVTGFERKEAQTGSGIPMKRAGGGPVSAGQPYFVGDNPDGSLNRTTELFVPKTSGYIMNSKDLQNALNGGSSGSNNVFNITLPNVNNAQDFAREFRLATEGRF